MMCFFSGEDASELQDNVRNHSHYLSLIVNFAGAYCAKAAFVGQHTTELRYKDKNDVEQITSSTKDVMLVIEFNIERVESEVEVPGYLGTRFQWIDEEAKKKVVTPFYTGFGGGTYAAHVPGRGQGQWEDDSSYRRTYEGFGGQVGKPIVKGKDEFDWEDQHTPGYWDDEWDAFYKNSEEKQGRKEQWQGIQAQRNVVVVAGGLANPTLRDSEAKELICDWLSQCLDLVSTQKTAMAQFLNIKEGLVFYNEMFKLDTKKEKTEYQFFLIQAQKILVDVTEKFRPSVVSRRFSSIIDDYRKEIPFAKDLYEIALSHDDYVREVKRSMKNND